MKPRAVVAIPARVNLPTPPRTQFVIEVPENGEVILEAPDGFEVCAGKKFGKVRVWTRRKTKR